MTDINQKLDAVKSKENFLEKMVRFIPGYNGYVNRDNARELDTLLRNALAKNIEGNKTKLKNTVLALSQRGKLFESDGISKLEKKLDTIVAKFKSASRGYSGAFDVVKVKEDKLQQLYSFDEGLFTHVESINNACTEIENNAKANVDIKPAQQNISDMMDGLIKMFDEREQILKTV